MGMPLQWHRRQAIVLASQLPDNTADAVLVVLALKELVDQFLVANDMSIDCAVKLSANILPFAG